MIVSASRRTDIPAFYSGWFMNRVRAGFCLVANPRNPKSIYRVSLLPRDVDVFVFWTKNPAPMMHRLDELDAMGYRYYFQFTLTPYGKELEGATPDLEERIEAFAALSRRLGRRRVIWRYDPIVISNRTSFGFHEASFERLARSLAGRTERVMISFVSWYRKTERRLGELEKDGWRFEPAVQESERAESFLTTLAKIAESCGMRMFTCADGHDYSHLGIGRGSCIDGRLIQDLWGISVPITKDPGQRENCLCAPSRDIGANDTCLHGCRYCYSTVNNALALRRFRQHDPQSPMMWGKYDKSGAAKAEKQISLFD